jgi:hypothetical protein
MNLIPKRFAVLLVALIATVFDTASASPPPVTLTVTPSVISNSYPGLITLTITGVTNTEKVGIQRWIDLNGNGTIDVGEPMLDAFKVTDNDNSGAIIGGITNLNVPIDGDPTAGAITTTLNFVGAMALENMVGHYVYSVVSPTGRFAPVTATFVVTNTPLPQSVSGTVFSGDGVTPLPYAVVVAQDQQKNEPVGGVVSDSNGHYFLPLPVSSYFLIAALPGYYYNQQLAPSVILTNGMAATNNLTVTNGTTTISGNVYDTAKSNGIGGLLLTLQSGHLFSVAFTDSNGNYSAALTPSFWDVQPDKQRLVRRAFVLPEATPFQFDATGGNVTNANIGLPKTSALFYGRITDISNVAYANIEVDGSANNNYDAKGYSDQNGYYSVAVLGDNTNDWFCSINSGKNTPLANFVMNAFGSLILSNSQTVLQNFVALPATATISGHVQDNSGTNVVVVGLNASANIGGNYYQSLDGTTDNSGNYSLSVASGQWTVQFFTGNFSDALDHAGYVDLSGPHVVNIPPTNATLNITVYPLGTPLITGPQRFGSQQFSFAINGAVNLSYTVQVSTNLVSTNWANLFSFQLTNNPFVVTDYNATNSPRYYRVLKN